MEIEMFGMRQAIAALAILSSVAVCSAEEYDIRVVTPETPPSFDNLYLQIAYDKGIFKKNGLNVTSFLQLKGGPLATTAVVSGQADVTATDVEGILQATKAGYPVRGVAAPSKSLSYVVAVRKEIKSFKDLKGQAFSVSRAGALSQYVTFPFLDRENVARSDIKWVSVGGSKDRMTALAADRVKGAVLYLDNAYEVRNDPNIHIIANIAELMPLYPHELLLVRKEDIDKRPEKVVRIVQSIMEACRFMVDHRDETIEVFMKYANAERPLAEELYDTLKAMKPWGTNGGMTEESINAAVDLSLQNKAIDVAVPILSFVDFQFQAEALRRLGGPVSD